MTGIKLDDIRLCRLHFELTGKPVGPDSELAYELYGNNAYDAESRKLWLTIGARSPSDSGDGPFIFDIAYIGIFTFDMGADDTVISRCTDINCPAIIFPFVREMLADLTRRAGQSPVVLPVVNFVARHQKNQASIGTGHACAAEKKQEPKKPRKSKAVAREKTKKEP